MQIFYEITEQCNCTSRLGVTTWCLWRKVALLTCYCFKVQVVNNPVRLVIYLNTVSLYAKDNPIESCYYYIYYCYSHFLHVLFHNFVQEHFFWKLELFFYLLTRRRRHKENSKRKVFLFYLFLFFALFPSSKRESVYENIFAQSNLFLANE